MEIFVANISFASTEDDVSRHFGAFGTVERVSIVRDRESGRSRGFGFVEMPDDDEALAAIDALDGAGLQGRALAVSKALPKGRARERRPERRG